MTTQKNNVICLFEVHMQYSRWRWSPALQLLVSKEKRMNLSADAVLHGGFSWLCNSHGHCIHTDTLTNLSTLTNKILSHCPSQREDLMPSQALKAEIGPAKTKIMWPSYINSNDGKRCRRDITRNKMLSILAVQVERERSEIQEVEDKILKLFCKKSFKLDWRVIVYFLHNDASLVSIIFLSVKKIMICIIDGWTSCWQIQSIEIQCQDSVLD